MYKCIHECTSTKTIAHGNKPHCTYNYYNAQVKNIAAKIEVSISSTNAAIYRRCELILTHLPANFS